VWAGGMTGSASERGRHSCRFGVLHEVRVVTEDGREVRGVQTDQPCALRMRFETFENNLYAKVGYDVRSRGQLLFRTGQAKFKLFREAGMWEASMRLPAFFFNEMTYSVIPSLGLTRPGDDPRQPREHHAYTVMADPLSFIVYGKTGKPVNPDKKSARQSGFLAPSFKFSFQRLNDQAQPIEPDVARV
jgi:hypothetical protein